jgi:hypothetical protein
MQVGQIDREVLDRMQLAFGFGVVRGPFQPAPSARPNSRPYYRFTIQNFEQVQAAVAFMWPWLGTVKREQAKAVLMVRRTLKPMGRPPKLKV